MTWGGVPRRHRAEPPDRLVARQAGFLERRHFGRSLDPAPARHRKRAQLSGFHVGDRRGYVHHADRHLPAEHVGGVSRPLPL